MRYELPLSKAMGKIRIKERLTFGDYGKAVPPTQTIITHKHYIEWQIGYDKVVPKSEDYHFIGANGKPKQIYELSEFLAYALQNRIITKNEIVSLKQSIQSNNDFIDERAQITRTHFVQERIAGIEFLQSSVSYPLLVHKFSDKDMICEIIVREKQFAVGTMPMLYFCVALGVLKDKNNGTFIGRAVQSGESGFLEISDKNRDIFMQMFRIFGLLSKSHKHDCLAILGYLESKGK